MVKLASSLAPTPLPPTARQNGTGLAYVARPILSMVLRSMSFPVSSSMPELMYAFVHLICTPQADAGSENLRWKEIERGGARYMGGEEAAAADHEV